MFQGKSCKVLFSLYKKKFVLGDNDCITQLRLLLRSIDSFLGENRQNIINKIH